MEYKKLYNGVEMPYIGYGTWLIENENAKSNCLNAIETGYNHIDTAQAYGNEKGVGEGIKASNIKREDIFITSKVAAEIKSYDDAVKSIEESLKKLDSGYIDLMLIHCPQPWNEYGQPYRYEKENIEVWKALTEYYKKGLIKAIGVSNFNIHDITNIMNNSEIKPMVNQIPVHIGHTDKELIEFCNDNDILVEAYSPNAHGRILSNPEIKKIADKYNVSISKLSIKYTIELGCVPLPKTTSINHMKENLELDFEISQEDMKILKQFKNL